MIRINKWGLFVPFSPYQAPELRTMCLSGHVTDHPRLGEGNITTSAIKHAELIGEDIIVHTVSGSRYVLGEVDPAYEEEYPNARQRFIDTIVGAPRS